MTSIESPFGPALNPALAPFFGAAVASQETSAADAITVGGEATFDNALDYGELFASLINAPQESGLFLTPKSGVEAITQTVSVESSADSLVPDVTIKTSFGAVSPTQTGAIDLTAFEKANGERIEPLFGLKLSNGNSFITEPGSSTFQKLQAVAIDPSTFSNVVPQSVAGASALQTIVTSAAPDLTLSGLSADQVGLDATRANTAHMLPLKALASFMEGLPTETTPTAKLTPEATVTPAQALASQTGIATAPSDVTDTLMSVPNTAAQSAPIAASETVRATPQAAAMGSTVSPHNDLGITDNPNTGLNEPVAQVGETTEAQTLSALAEVDMDTTEAEGHLVATQAPNTKARNSATQAAPTAANTPSAQNATAQAAAAQIAGAQPKQDAIPSKTESDRNSDKVAATTFKSDIPDFAPAKPIQIQPAFKSWSDTAWSGAWTPERIAGFGEGAGGDLISGGLAGLRGDGSSFSAISIMGGKANPAMSSHVARQLNINVTKAVKAGEQEFAMRMDPPELGRVTVKLRFMADGIVKAHVMAERPETMDLLQREVRGLERAIEAGGSKSTEEGISFSLDSGNQESAGKAFAEALQHEKLQERTAAGVDPNNSDLEGVDPPVDDLTTELNLEDILAHMTPETGIDVRV